jgi:hypothetical protein
MCGGGIMKITLAYVGSILLVGTLSYFGWVLAKTINYKLQYEDMVQATVCEMVKPEYLKGECK